MVIFFLFYVKFFCLLLAYIIQNFLHILYLNTQLITQYGQQLIKDIIGFLNISVLLLTSLGRLFCRVQVINRLQRLFNLLFEENANLLKTGMLNLYQEFF